MWCEVQGSMEKTCLACLEMSYRTLFSSMVSTRSNMGTLQYWESNVKQAVTRSCFLPSYNVWDTNLLNLYAFPMRSSWSLRFSPETWKHSESLPQVYRLYSYMAAFRTSLPRTSGQPQRGSSQRNPSPNLNLWNQLLAERLFTALSTEDLYGVCVQNSFVYIPPTTETAHLFMKMTETVENTCTKQWQFRGLNPQFRA